MPGIWMISIGIAKNIIIMTRKNLSSTFLLILSFMNFINWGYIITFWILDCCPWASQDLIWIIVEILHFGFGSEVKSSAALDCSFRCVSVGRFLKEIGGEVNVSCSCLCCSFCIWSHLLVCVWLKWLITDLAPRAVAGFAQSDLAEFECSGQSHRDPKWRLSP